MAKATFKQNTTATLLHIVMQSNWQLMNMR